MTIRQAAVAGMFYEADPGRLQQHISTLLADASSLAIETPRGLIVPHAGYVYSGPTAAEAYRLLEPLRDTVERVVLLGPAHRVYLEGMAIPSVDAFATPLGQVPLDLEGLAASRTLPGVLVNDEAHREEHSLEVQLPFLQNVLGRFRLLPVVVGECDAATVAGLIDALWAAPDALLVASTDLSHFHTYRQAQQLDRLTCDRLLSRDSTLVGTDACGARVLNGLMRSRLGQRLHIEQLDYCNSGDTAGDKARVVGYGAFVLY